MILVSQFFHILLVSLFKFALTTTSDELFTDWLFDSSNSIPKKVNVSALIPRENCGDIAVLDRIVGGKPTALMEYPWLAYLEIERATGSYRCGGSLINSRYIITAAHCVTSIISVSVRLGEYDTNTNPDCIPGDNTKCAPDIQHFTIEDVKKDVIIHKNYGPKHNDIALLRLPQPANLTVASVKPICLPIDDVDPNIDQELVVVSGWGITEHNTESNVLRDVTLMIMPNMLCKSYFKWITSKQMCAIGEGSKDSCNGDSGGPLQRVTKFNGASKHVLYGIVSIGTKKCGISVPAVYTRVTSYMHWIMDNIKP